MSDMTRRKVNTIIAAIIVVLLMSISIGYSALSQSLTISGSSSYQFNVAAINLSYDNTATEVNCQDAQCMIDCLANKSLCPLPSIYTTVKTAITTNGRGSTYSGSHQDSVDGSGTKAIYYYTNGTYNNVIFGNFCWKIVRTTDTGGVKIIYNGTKSASNTCTATGSSTQIGTYSYANSSYVTSPPAVGFMLDNSTAIPIKSGTVSGAIYGTTISYNVPNDKFSLSSTGSSLNTTHHCSCGSSSSSCSPPARYYFTSSSYVELGSAVFQRSSSALLNAWFVNSDINKNSSNAKTRLENWYSSNMTTYTQYLEDAVWCNDRSYANTGNYISSNNGWNPNGGLLSNPSGEWYAFLNFRGSVALKGTSYQQNLDCPNVTDRFAVGNTSAKLTYPVGLITAQEGYFGTTSVFNTGAVYWTMTPCSIDDAAPRMRRIDETGDVVCERVNQSYGIRPVISLKGSNIVSSGTGTTSSPYIITPN